MRSLRFSGKSGKRSVVETPSHLLGLAETVAEARALASASPAVNPDYPIVVDESTGSVLEGAGEAGWLDSSLGLSCGAPEFPCPTSSPHPGMSGPGLREEEQSSSLCCPNIARAC